MSVAERNRLNWDIRYAQRLRAKIKPDWFTSLTLAPKAKLIHRIDKDRSTVVLVDDKLYLRPVAVCGARPSPLNVQLLTDSDYYKWIYEHSDARRTLEKYGQRNECQWCWRVYDA